VLSDRDLLLAILERLTELRDVLDAGLDTDRYCLPLVEDGEVICPGGVLLRPSHDPGGDRKVDKFYHPLPEDKHRMVPLGDEGMAKRKNHTPWKSQTTRTPPAPAAAEDVRTSAPQPAPAPASTPRDGVAPRRGEVPMPSMTSTPLSPEGVPVTEEWDRLYTTELRPRLTLVLTERFGLNRESSKHEPGSPEWVRARATVWLAFWTYFSKVPLAAPCQLDEAGGFDFTPATIAAADIPLLCTQLDEYLAGTDIRAEPF
jgi:hypothetical protein